METKLIKLKDKFILVNDEEIKEGDYFYVKTPNISGGNIIAQSISNGKYAWEEHILTKDTDEKGYHKSHCKKIISENPDFSDLKEEDCKEIGWVDVEKLANELYPDSDKLAPHRHITPSIKKQSRHKQHFIEGFKTAQFLNDKCFGLDDMERAIQIGIDLASKHHDSAHGIDYDMVEMDKDKYIQSLQQTEWDVEVEMERKTYQPTDNKYEKLGEPFNVIEPKITNGKIKLIKIL